MTPVELQFAANQTKDPEGFFKKVNYLYAHPDEVIRDEIELVDGTILDRYSSSVRDKAGRYYGRIWAFRDITELKENEQKLRQTEAELARVARLTTMGELTASIAHEVNQPLAAVVTNANAVLHVGSPPCRPISKRRVRLSNGSPAMGIAPVK
jgi:signal transduction histidine kinase